MEKQTGNLINLGDYAAEYKRGLAANRTDVFTPKKFGGRVKSEYVKPKFARFKLFCQYYNGNASYFSYDYNYTFNLGYKKKVYSEIYGLYDMIEWFVRMDPYKYRYMTVFANITNNLNTDTGDFGYHIASIVKGTLCWKRKLQWIDEGRKLDTTVYTVIEKKLFTQSQLTPKAL